MTKLINGLIAGLLALLVATAFAGGVKMRCGPDGYYGGEVCVWTLVVKQPPTS